MLLIPAHEGKVLSIGHMDKSPLSRCKRGLPFLFAVCASAVLLIVLTDEDETPSYSSNLHSLSYSNDDHDEGTMPALPVYPKSTQFVASTIGWGDGTEAGCAPTPVQSSLWARADEQRWVFVVSAGHTGSMGMGDAKTWDGDGTQFFVERALHHKNSFQTARLALSIQSSAQCSRRITPLTAGMATRTMVFVQPRQRSRA
jgi:hypothetical protein